MSWNYSGTEPRGQDSFNLWRIAENLERIANALEAEPPTTASEVVRGDNSTLGNAPSPHEITRSDANLQTNVANNS